MRTSLIYIFLILSAIFLLSGCEGRQLPPDKMDPETAAKKALSDLTDEFNARIKTLEGEATDAEQSDKLAREVDSEFRLKLEELEKKYPGTDTAASITIGFAMEDMQNGEFASAEKRLDGLIASLTKGDTLALALVQKSILASDRDLDEALALAKRAETTDGASEGTRFEAKLQELKILLWEGRDDEFEAMYLPLSDYQQGRYLAALALMRLQYFLERGDLDSIAGLIEKVQPSIPPEMLTMLKAEVAGQTLIGKPAPPLDGTDVAGRVVNADTYKGKVVAVVFFTTGNQVFKRWVPILNSLYDEYASSGFEIIGVNMDDNSDNLAAFISANEIMWPVIYDAEPELKLQKEYWVVRDPKAFVIGRDGRVVSQGLEGVLLDREIRELVKQSSMG